MINKYTSIPTSISKSLINSVRVSFSPSDHRAITKPKQIKTLSSLLSKKEKKGNEIGGEAYMAKSPYRFLKTVNIQDSFILDESQIEYCKPNNKAIKPLANSILIVKDGGGDGLGTCCLYEPTDGFTDYISAGVLHIQIDNEATRNYVLGVLKSNHFKEYIDWVTPGGSTIRHSKLLALNYEVPWTINQGKFDTVATLVANITDKEKQIKIKNKLIDKAIDNEIKAGATQSKVFSFPSKSDILVSSRIDAGLYSDLVRTTDLSITSYKHGFYNIPDYFTANRGQNLQVTSVGESYYSDTKKSNFYRLFTNVEMTDLRTITGFRWLGNKMKLKTLPKDCVLFAADGMIVGRSFFFDDLPNTITNIHPWVIVAKDKKITPQYRSVFLSVFLSYLKNIGYLEKIKDKSNGGGLKKSHVEKLIKVPKFPDNIQSDIATLYYNNVMKLKSNSTLEEHRLRNQELGIYQLNMEVLADVEKLSSLVDDIILNG